MVLKLCIISGIASFDILRLQRDRRRNSTKFKDYDSYGFSICLIIPSVNLKSSDVLQEKLFVPSLVCQ